MAVHDDCDVFSKELSCPLDCLVDDSWCGCTGCILEAKAVERDSCIKDSAEDAFVEVWVVCASCLWRKAHHRDCDLVLETCIMDCLSAVDEVVDVVECIEVPDRRHSMLLEHVCMELDDVSWL